MVNGLRNRLFLGDRADAVELLDSGELTRLEIERNLADLARLNRLPGGASTSVRGVRSLIGTRGASIVDVGTGCGDIPMAFARHGWRTVAVDINAEVLPVARAWTTGQPLVEVRNGDARSLPFEDGAFDVAHCSLLVHHLQPREAIGALRELRRVARHGVVVNDLRRGLWPLVSTWATTLALGRSPVTRNDGLVSARRAYTLAELDELLEEAGLVPRWRSSTLLPRVVTAASP